MAPFNMVHLKRAEELSIPPPVGSPYSVALPSSEKPGRSKVYRHWRFRDELLKTLDPKQTYTPLVNVLVIDNTTRPQGLSGLINGLIMAQCNNGAQILEWA
ncbi:MAG: hypothetical protein M1830_009005 [Pleopsidium flavum]|nr:MAG: hypothetical protein M1830_009005 [Pleopsidium flavum]